MRSVAIALAAGLAGLGAAPPAVAQVSIHRVVNVAPSDVLNIRATPSPTSAIVGSLAPGTSQVEVLERRHGWGRVLVDGGEGWVSLAYLAESERAAIPGLDAPGGFACAGTEPFWGLTIGTDGSGSWNDLATLGEARAVSVDDARTAGNRHEPFVYRFSGEAEGMAVLSREACSDGMSDIAYGWRAYVDVADGAGRRFVTGCCRTPPVAGE